MDGKSEDVLHWADSSAEKIIKEKGARKLYTLAAGITPSGVVHVGNFREIITAELIKRALEDKGESVRFIYSWDDFDAFRKVPVNLPNQDELKRQLRLPVSKVKDPFEDSHESYARHFEEEIEATIPQLGISPEYLYQHKKYSSCEYAEGINIALKKTEIIKEVMNKFRAEELTEDWIPVEIFCSQCGMDQLESKEYLKDYTLRYKCRCGHEETFDFRKRGLVKLKWRVDWPMRWWHEKVDFESGGKDHFASGGSHDTGVEIAKKVYNYDAPYGFMYEFVSIKGLPGKISSSKGNVVTVQELLEVYEPEMVRWLFAGTRPSASFSISFDADVIKLYEDFDRCERIYFGEEKADEKETKKQKRIYELSSVGKIPRHIPFQPGFRHLTTILLTNEMNHEKAVGYFEKQLKNDFDRERLHRRAVCAKNWLEKYAPDEFRFTVQEKLPKNLNVPKEYKDAFLQLAQRLKEKDWTDRELHEEFYILINNFSLNNKEFFRYAYQILISRDKGPLLANFMLTLGKERVRKLLLQL